MARPAKPVGMTEGHRTKKEIEQRTHAENALKGNPIRIPQGLSASQRKICKHIITELEESKLLCSLDKYVLEQCCVSADSLHKINMLINEKPQAFYDKALLSAKEKHEKTFFRCCDALCLSPQSRAKIAAVNAECIEDKGTELLKRIISGDMYDDEEYED